MAVLNSTVLERVWISGSNDFQQRVSNPSNGNIAKTVQDIFDPANNDLYNAFTGLLNGFMRTYIDGKRFENPLRSLKKPMTQNPAYGSTERHIAVQYMQAHSYRANSETILRFERPEFEEWFYSVNRKERYEFSWPRMEVMRAFSEEGYGFNELLARTLDQMISSDEYDEMMTMIQVFAETDKRWGGLFRYNLSAAPTTEATAKELLRGIREVAGRMKFPSRLYNHIPVPVFEYPQTLVVWVTPETRAVIDVEALSAVFQLDKAEIQYRIIEIPEFPLPNIYAAVTSEDFIYCRDVVYGVYPAPFNVETLSDKYYLHHQSMIGGNPAANCVLFTTEEGSVISTVTMQPTGAAFDPDTVNVEIGGAVQLDFKFNGTIDGNGGSIAVEPDAAIYEVSAYRAGDEDATVSVPLNTRTYVDRYGVLHVQKSGLQVGDVIAIEGTATYTNPSGATTEYTATASATVVAATENGAKECEVETEPYIDYTGVTEDTTASE